MFPLDRSTDIGQEGPSESDLVSGVKGDGKIGGHRRLSSLAEIGRGLFPVWILIFGERDPIVWF